MVIVGSEVLSDEVDDASRELSVGFSFASTSAMVVGAGRELSVGLETQD
jgi:hypothetical protein